VEAVELTCSHPAGTPADFLFQGWGATLHYGDPSNPWVRIIFLLAGLSPLILTVPARLGAVGSRRGRLCRRGDHHPPRRSTRPAGTAAIAAAVWSDYGFAQAAIIYAACLALACAWTAARRKAPGRGIRAAILIVEAAFLAVAAGEAVSWAAGQRFPQPPVHLAYLILSVTIMSVTAGRTLTEPRSRPGDALVLAVALTGA
jgi:hypothetical protein